MTEETKEEKKTRRVFVECVTVRKIGVGPENSDEKEDRMTEVGETVRLTKESAKILQDAMAIKIKL